MIRKIYMEIWKERNFPNLTRKDDHVTSVDDVSYNCINYAAGRDDAWWCPLNPQDGATWPDGVPAKWDVESLVILFNQLGYEVCEDADLEEGSEKVAIFCEDDGRPTHAARQLSTGAWKSKLGEWEDIEHKTLRCLEGDHPAYGSATTFLKRPAKKMAASS
jgi:hypothetical protein